MTRRSALIPRYAFPPSKYIKDELEERGWSQEDLAEKMDMPTFFIHVLVERDTPLNQGLANKLEQVFDIDADQWLWWQLSWENWYNYWWGKTKTTT